MPDPSVDFLESFDYYPANLAAPGIGVNATWIPNGGSNNCKLIAGRFGHQALYVERNTSNGTQTRLIPTATQKTLGVACRFPGLSTQGADVGKAMLTFSNDSSQELFNIGVNNLGEVRLYSGALGSNMMGKSLADDPLLQNTWHYLEFRFIADAANGHCEFYIDGKQQFVYDGDTSGARADLGMSRIQIRADYFGSDNYYHLDDMYLMSNQPTVLGEARLAPLEMSADDAVQFLRASGATNAAMINASSLMNDTTYNSSNTPGDVDLFTHPALDVNPDKVHFLSLTTAAKKIDSGTRTIKQVLIDANGTQYGADQNLTSDYTWIRDYFTKQSDTTDWDKESIDGAKTGYELVL